MKRVGRMLGSIIWKCNTNYAQIVQEVTWGEQIINDCHGLYLNRVTVPDFQILPLFVGLGVSSFALLSYILLKIACGI